MKKYKPYDVLKTKKINYPELSQEMKYEVSILGGLDIFTDAHVQGVVDITTRICEHMKMDYEYLKHCVLGAYLHDVGKIMIPNEVLQKAGKLTDEEYEIIKSHTLHGYEICMKYKEVIKDFISDTYPIIEDAIKENKLIIVEGAQSFYLDNDHGDYPMTLSNMHQLQDGIMKVLMEVDIQIN